MPGLNAAICPCTFHVSVSTTISRRLSLQPENALLPDRARPYAVAVGQTLVKSAGWDQAVNKCVLSGKVR